MILEFKGKYSFLSNKWPCKILLDGVEFFSVDNAYMAAQSTNPENRKYIRDLTPGQAKVFSRLQPLRPDWENVQLSIMEDLVRQKFQNVDLKHKLLETGDTIIRNDVEPELSNLLVKVRKELQNG